MTATTRRALFAAAPVLALAATPVAAAINPDAELLTLADRWHRAMLAEEAADDACEEAQQRAQKSVEVPAALYPRLTGTPDFVAGLPMLRRGQRYREFHRDRIQTMYEGNRKIFEAVGCNRFSMDRCKEVLDALDWHAAAIAAAEAKEGVARLREAGQQAYLVVADIEAQILALRATTIDGLRVKAKIAGRYGAAKRFEDDGESFASSLLADLGVA